MEKFLYPRHLIRCNITEPSEYGESAILTKLILNIFIEYEKVYIYSPSLHQNLYQKINTCLSSFIPIHIIPNILNEDDIHLIMEEVNSNKDFEKSNTEIETYESIEELKYPQEYDDGGYYYLGWFNWKRNERPQSTSKNSKIST